MILGTGGDEMAEDVICITRLDEGPKVILDSRHMWTSPEAMIVPSLVTSRIWFKSSGSKSQ